MNKDIINDYYLERYVLGELPEEETQEIHHMASENPSIKTTLDEIELSNQNILSLYPPSNVKASLLSRYDVRNDRSTVRKWLTISSFPSKRIFAISSVCTALLILIFFLVLPDSSRKTGVNPYDAGQDFSLVKGINSIDLTKTQLLVFRKNKEDVEILDSGTQSNKGDLLQLAYVAAQKPFGIILSMDGRGEITLHFPEKKDGSTELLMNKRSLLPHAIELDDAPYFERFFFITSRNKINVENVLRIAGDLAKNPDRVRESELDLPEGMDQYSVLILKGEDL